MAKPVKTDAQALPEVSVPDIDRCVQTGIYEQTFSAGGVVASVGGTVFHRQVYGSLSQPPPPRRLRTDALFDLASLTKPLGAGLAALKLVSQNRLDLNAPLSKTIATFKDEKFARVTIDMLLEHTSGFPATRNFWQEVRARDEKRPEGERVGGTAKAVPEVQELLADTRLEYEPGTKTVYSDLGFLALGWVIEGVVGKPLDVYLAREVFAPLGLDRDLLFVRLDDPRAGQRLRQRQFVATEQCAWRGRLLQGEVHDPNAWILGGVAGHAGLFGTADAVWKLTHALWSSFKGQGRDFLGGLVQRFWTRSRRLRDTTRTLAWDTPGLGTPSCGKRFSKSSVGHTGFTGTSIWVDLNTDVIGVVLTNAAHPSPEGKKEKMESFRPRMYELIAKHGEAMPRDAAHKTGAAAFYSGPIVGTSIPLHNPLRGPTK